MSIWHQPLAHPFLPLCLLPCAATLNDVLNGAWKPASLQREQIESLLRVHDSSQPHIDLAQLIDAWDDKLQGIRRMFTALLSDRMKQNE